MLSWANQFGILLFLDSNHYTDPYGKYECLLATGNETHLTATTLQQLQQLHNASHDWVFGHICYDYKNTIDPQLVSTHPARLLFPELHFFIPDVVCYIPAGVNELHIASLQDPDLVLQQILAVDITAPAQPLPEINFLKRMNEREYLQKVARLRAHIREGDCYEINLCAEGFAENAVVDPITVFEKLNQRSPSPFAAYYRLGQLHAMCASPERYLQKTGSTLLSQPIKGTIARKADAADDVQQKKLLRQSVKEQAENVMITDLVRNDLARSCTTGSIEVPSLFQVHTFPQVHHLISTVTGQLRDDLQLTDAIHNSFPMGSMTGAPKRIVMQLTDQYENSRRELFSGTVGYITPGGDIDLNVMIRSLYYNAATKYLAYQTGGAITYDSVAQQEWEELQLKARAMESLFKPN